MKKKMLFECVECGFQNPKFYGKCPQCNTWNSMIEVKEAATPLTNWRYTGNTEGAIYGFEQSVDNTFMNRIQNRTPVKGLYLASAWGNPGGGFGGVFGGGQRTFRMLMEDWGGS